MFQQFFTKTIESKFIKNLLYNTPLPVYSSVRNGDYIFKNNNYIYQDQVIRCLTSGYLADTTYIWDKYTAVVAPGTETRTVHIESGDITEYKAFCLINENDQFYLTNPGKFTCTSTTTLSDIMIALQNKYIYVDSLPKTVLYIVNIEENETEGFDCTTVIPIIAKGDFSEQVSDTDSTAFPEDSAQNADWYVFNTTKIQATYKVLSPYHFGQYYPKFTEKYISEYGYYDSDTHEQLGKYLRYIRDLYNVNLLPFYNCYSRKTADNFHIRKAYTDGSSSIDIILPKGRMLGDINGDGKLTFTADAATVPKSEISDYTYLLRIVGEWSGYEELDEIQTWCADCYPDNTINTLDAMWLGRHGTGMKDIFANAAALGKKVDYYDNWKYDADDKLFFTEIDNVNLTESHIADLVAQELIVKGTQLTTGNWYLYRKEPPLVAIAATAIGLDQRATYSVVNYSNSDKKVLQVPIKFNTEYTIAIDTEAEVQMVPVFIKNGRFVTTMDANKNPLDLTVKLAENLTSEVISTSNLNFKHPYVYSVPLVETTVNQGYIQYLKTNEANLYLLIQVPANEDSSVIVIEGDYSNQSGTLKHYEGSYINLFEPQELDKIFISNLSLLKLNTRSTSAFSDRLIEYLTLNVINPLETIDDNITLTQMSFSLTDLPETLEGVWTDRIRSVAFNSIINNKKVEHYDLTGYIDKDIEKNYIKDTEDGE